MSSVTEEPTLFNPYAMYYFTSAINKKMVLDVSQREEEKNNVIIYEKHGGLNQKFKIKEYKGKYLILSWDDRSMKPSELSS